MTKIIKFSAKNWMGIRAAEITPDGSPVVIGGENGAGKSSLLTGLQTLLRGKKHCPDMPVRTGTRKAVLDGDLGEFKVHREFTNGRDTLTVTDAEGSKIAKPQGYLDALADPTGFDVSKWLRFSGKEQGEQISKMAGVDLGPLDAERKAVFDERRDVNRDLKRAQAQVEGADRYPDAPDAEVSVTDLAAELERRQKVNQGHDQTRSDLQQARNEVEWAQETVVRCQGELDEATAVLVTWNELVKTRATEVDALNDEDAVEIRTQIDSADGINRKVRANAKRDDLVAEREALTTKSQALTDALDDIDERKRAIIAAADYPIDGITVEDGAVMFEGVPFSQVNKAERLRVATAVAIGMVKKNGLEVVIIEEAAFLTPKGRQMVTDMVTGAGAQLWIEVPGDGPGVNIFIEDGAPLSKEELQRRRDETQAAEIARYAAAATDAAPAE